MAYGILFIPGMWHGGWCYEEHFVPWFRERGYDARSVTLRHTEARHSAGARTARIRDYVEDVAASAVAFKAPPVVVGHSMGGYIAQHYLESHHAPAAVMLASAPPGGIVRDSLRIGANHPLRLLAANATLNLYEVVKTPERARELFFSALLDDDSVARYQAKMTDGSYLAYMDLLGLDRPNVDKIRARHVPMLVLRGEGDASISAGDAAAITRAYDAEFKSFPVMGHDLMLDVGWEDVAGAIDEFVRRHSVQPAPTATRTGNSRS